MQCRSTARSDALAIWVAPSTHATPATLSHIHNRNPLICHTQARVLARPTGAPYCPPDASNKVPAARQATNGLSRPRPPKWTRMLACRTRRYQRCDLQSPARLARWVPHRLHRCPPRADAPFGKFAQDSTDIAGRSTRGARLTALDVLRNGNTAVRRTLALARRLFSCVCRCEARDTSAPRRLALRLALS